MVVAFHTLMLADCSPFSRLLERLWGINWNGSPEVEGSHELAATCLNLTQLNLLDRLEPHSMDKSSQHWEAICPGTSTLWNILWNILWNMLWHILNIWSPHWVLNRNRYESVWICWMCQGPLGTTVLTSPWLSRWENGCVQLGQHGGSSPRPSV